MSKLIIFEKGIPALITKSQDEIKTILKSLGGYFNHFKSNCDILENPNIPDYFIIYETAIVSLLKEFESKHIDIIDISPEQSNFNAYKEKFLEEHTHEDYEVRFFVRGNGLFYINLDDAVYGILCSVGDAIGVPPNVKHWFDFGDDGSFTCIRIFTNGELWHANYTNDKHAINYPTFDTFIEL